MVMYRPLVVLSYMLTYALAGYSPWPYLLFNILVHALVAMLIALLVADRSGRAVIGWWTGALFAVHPINAQVVVRSFIKHKALVNKLTLTTVHSCPHDSIYPIKAIQ